MVKNILEIYKCETCGNMVEILHAGGGELVCCDKPMRKYEENTKDADREKHMPVIEKKSNGYKVTIGKILHPMTEEHHIEWIELIADGKAYREFLKPGDQPVVEFSLKASSVTAREYCNLHGLWKS